MVAAAVATACGSDDAAGKPRTALVWTPCRVDFECATVEVPVDYASGGGAGETIAISLLRAPALNPDTRLGTVLVNPGGPGIPMVEQLARTYRTLRIGFPVAFERFDIVAFDWRGIGESAPVRCVDPSFVDDVRKTDLTLADASSVAPTDALRRRLVEGCRATGREALLARMDTANAARDLDRVREALGEEKLNYLGLSYGTWLGATYATLFPDRVRAFALDTPVFVGADARAQLRGRAQALDLGFTRFAEACARAPGCAFHGGGSPADVSLALDQLVTRIRSSGVPAAGRTLSVVDFEYAMADGLRIGDASKLARDLAAAEAGDASALLARSDVVMGRRADGTYDSTLVGLLAIGCLDQPTVGSTVDEFRAFAASLSPLPRAAGAAGLPFALCVDWPFRRVAPPPAIDASGAPKMLVVSGANDPISTTAMVEPFMSALGNGSHLVVYDGEGHVGATHSQCVRDAITEFVIDPTKAPVAAHCAPD